MTKQDLMDALAEKHRRAQLECLRQLEALATSEGGSCFDAEGKDTLAVLSTQWKQMNAIAELTALVNQLHGAEVPAQPPSAAHLTVVQ